MAGSSRRNLTSRQPTHAVCSFSTELVTENADLFTYAWLPPAKSAFEQLRVAPLLRPGFDVSDSEVSRCAFGWGADSRPPSLPMA